MLSMQLPLGVGRKKKLHLLKSPEVPFCMRSGSAQIEGLARIEVGVQCFPCLAPEKSESVEVQKTQTNPNMVLEISGSDFTNPYCF